NLTGGRGILPAVAGPASAIVGPTGRPGPRARMACVSRMEQTDEAALQRRPACRSPPDPSVVAGRLAAAAGSGSDRHRQRAGPVAGVAGPGRTSDLRQLRRRT